MSKKTFLQRNEKILSISLLAAVILVWAAILTMDSPNQQSQGTYSLDACQIEYGHSKCINGSLVTSFYNPGSDDITRVSMLFYDGDDVDIYNCRDPLSPETPSTLTTIQCTGEVDASEIVLEWCCGDDCQNATMSDPSTDLSLVYTV